MTKKEVVRLNQLEKELDSIILGAKPVYRNEYERGLTLIKKLSKDWITYEQVRSLSKELSDRYEADSKK